MTAPVALIEAVRAIGGELRVPSPGRLTVRAAKPLPDALMAKLKAAKPALIELLSTTAPLTDAGHVRAAIIEHDRRAPRAWADGIARLNAAHPPADISPQRWFAFVNDCARFIDGPWAGHAAALGWQPLDLFGCARPFARIDRAGRAGLLWLLNGNRLLAITPDTATIGTASGSRLTYRRVCQNAAYVALAWELNGEIEATGGRCERA